MTLPFSPSRAVFHGNGAATHFPFGFKVWDAAQLTVLLTDPQGVDSPAAGYGVELSGSGGTLTYLHEGSPLPTGWRLTVLRDMPFTQGVILVSGTQFDPQVIEDELDRAAAERQQLKEAVERAVKIPPASDVVPAALVNGLMGASATALNAASAAAQSETAAATHRDSAADSAHDCARIQNELRDLEGLAPATTDTRGFVMVGDGLEADADGRLSVLPVEIPRALPVGAIVCFSGQFGGSDGRRPLIRGTEEADEDWALCDGTNGTPDLRGRMIMGAGGTYAAGTTGGADTHSHGVTATIGNTTLTAAQMPNHGHGYTLFAEGAWDGIGADTRGGTVNGSAGTHAAGSSGAHGHTLASASAAAASSLPPFYALAFIMKL